MAGFKIHNHKGKQVSILDEAAPESASTRPTHMRGRESPASWPYHGRDGQYVQRPGPYSYPANPHSHYPHQLPTPPSQPSPKQRHAHEDDRMPAYPRKEGEYFNSRPYHDGQGQLPSPPVSPEAQQMHYTYQPSTNVVQSIEQTHSTESQGHVHHGQRPSFPSYHRRQHSDLYPTPGSMTPAPTPQPEGPPYRVNEFAPRYQYAPNQPLPVSHYPPRQEGYFVTHSPPEAPTLAVVSYQQPAVQHPQQPAQPTGSFEGHHIVLLNHPPSQCVIMQPAPQDPKAGKGKNNYPCPLSKEYNCNSFFTTSGHARRHAKKHTGEKSQICPECKKPFARKDNMDQHRKTHRRFGRARESRSSSLAPEEPEPMSARVDENGRITKQKSKWVEQGNRHRRLQQNVEHALDRLSHSTPPPSSPEDASSQTERSVSPAESQAQVQLTLRPKNPQATPPSTQRRVTLDDLANIAELAPRAGEHENGDKSPKTLNDSRA